MEIEAKLKLKSPSRLRSLLKSADAICSGLVLEKNWLYDYPDHALGKTDKLLRLRQDERVFMTFKGPREESEFKKREEMEIEFPDLPKAQSLLEAVGFCVRFYFEKYRESWMLDPCEVSLDEIPMLGLYVEIEGPNEEEIAKAVKRLKLPRNYIADSYVELLKEHAKKSASNAVDFIFPSDHKSILKQEKRSWR
jgi:adenylate cyclase class 2